MQLEGHRANCWHASFCPGVPPYTDSFLISGKVPRVVPTGASSLYLASARRMDQSIFVE